MISLAQLRNVILLPLGCLMCLPFILSLFESTPSLIIDFTLNESSEKSDIFQIFWLTDAGYSEPNSVRLGVTAKVPQHYVIDMPNNNTKKVRVDLPSGVSRIHQVQLVGPFFYKDFDLSSMGLESSNDLEPIELNQSDLIFQSNGNDPYIEVDLPDNYVGLTADSRWRLSFLICLILMFLVRLDRRRIWLSLFSVAAVSSIAICWTSYPGWMSYDSLHALRGARFGVTDAEWPPMVSYLWYISELFIPNPSFMQFVQVFIVLFFGAGIVLKLSNNVTAAISFIIAVLIHPLILGTMLVIWKDVLSAAFMFLFLFCVLQFDFKHRRAVKVIFLLILALIGISTRHNAIFAYVFLIMFLIWKLELWENEWVGTCKSLVLSILVSVLLLAVKTGMENYSLLSGDKLGGRSKMVFFDNPAIFDLAGASICLEENLLEKVGFSLTLDEIRASYHPEHLNLSAAFFNVNPGENLHSTWLRSYISHPLCMSARRLEFSRILLSFQNGQPFLLTHSGILENEFNYKVRKDISWISDHLIWLADSFVFKPWVLLLLAVLSTWVQRGKLLQLNDSKLLFLSGLSYLGSFIVFGNAADTRLLFYSNVIFLVIIISAVGLGSSRLNSCRE